MFKLSFLILTLVICIQVLAIQSPHGAKLSIKCEVCHSTEEWSNIKTNAFDHEKTNFPLRGQHQLLNCKKCHVDLVFSSAKKECNTCHKDVHQGTVGRDCERCHSPKTWSIGSIKAIHDQSNFPLQGKHTSTDCKQCHTSASLLRFDRMSTACVDCHLKDYDATTNPNHLLAKLPTDCQTCHTVSSWKKSTFNHNTATTFPLTGAHIGVDCIQCHANGYANTPSTCVSCHKKDYDATTNPNHLLAKLSTDCQTCHTVNSWKPSTFNHNTATTFPLKGAHIGVDCIRCHANGYANTPSTCVSCHKKNYDATTNPNHLLAKLSTDCQTCHTVNSWKPSTFNHNTATTFPLKGAHIGVDFIRCHANGYANTPNTCVSCHLSDYNATINPAHAAAKFPTNCETCHNVSSWKPSTFNHDSANFRIYSGKHRGQWTTCTQCHTNASNFGTFSCIVCHEHSSKASVDSDHRGVSGYVYSATSCFTCHPRI